MSDPGLAKNYRPSSNLPGSVPVGLPAADVAPDIGASVGPGPQGGLLAGDDVHKQAVVAEARVAVEAAYGAATAPLVVEVPVGDLADPDAMTTLGQAIDGLVDKVVPDPGDPLPG